ncbi:hypothetical protein [Marinivivus vitaminiproducens]|uniref:hypothetical protein n=1 Tax=Marinivivus vitaminiproducens TaxID=3035935 RepID=UPI0027A3680C|nr:hypothetical protein P4R82_23480 [Geminicoccaceae bacterium SCSIO 64248]
MSTFTAEPLSSANATIAYPLIRSFVPALRLEEWLGHITRLEQAEHAPLCGGILVRKHAARYPNGLALFRREYGGLTERATLLAEHLVALHLLDVEPTLVALLGEIDRLAQRLGCDVIRTHCIGPACLLAPSLVRLGHVQDGVILRKIADNSSFSGRPA